MFAIRTPALRDVPALAAVHVASWQEAYRGLMPDDVLDDPTFLSRRERQWRSTVEALGGDEDLRATLAEVDGKVVGLAMSGVVATSGPRADAVQANQAGSDGADPDVAEIELTSLYLLAAHHGSGAGRALLDAVVPPGIPAALWVADPNPRAQAFYGKNGFRADGAELVDRHGVHEIRMVR
jgi:GNAT superfamily N-acetyltransferase